jgi:hypothetical protein
MPEIPYAVVVNRVWRAMGRCKVVVLGHSYVMRVGRMIWSEKHGCYNMEFDGRRVYVKCHGVPGGTFGEGRKCLFDKLGSVIKEKPQVVFLQAGELDLANGMSCEGVVRRIDRMVTELTEKGVMVIVGQLLPFPAFERDGVVKVNNLLKEKYAGR